MPSALRPAPRLASVFLCCACLASCGDSFAPDIVGKWQSDAAAANTIEFFPDGTLREVALLKTSNGKYELLDDGRMHMEIDGIIWGTNVVNYKYTITDDKLAMTTEGGIGITLNWTRMK